MDKAVVTSLASRRSTLRMGVAGACRSLLSAALALLLSLPALRAQDSGAPAPAPPRRPRIGLVLGGGGAKGAAHVGVLKVLEDLRVPIDCIGGTSMGSIVGGAYASGFDADMLAEIMAEVKWTSILTSAPRAEIPYHRKNLDFIYNLGLVAGIKNGRLVLPGGAVSSQQIEALLRRVVVHPGESVDFDSLPIPFRAVATDLDSGEMKVFDRGDLAVAMRASMAVPGAFEPVALDGRLYADGMLVRNLPVDVVRAMGADVIIAVTVDNPPRTQADLASLMAVAGRAMDITIAANERAQLSTLQPEDVHVRVVLKDITSGDFNKVPQAIPIGAQTAQALRSSLSRYSVSPEEYAAWRARIGLVKLPPTPVIDEIRLTGFQTTNPEVMRTFIRTRVGEAYDPVKAERDVARLAARDDFSAVGQYLLNEDGRQVLVFNANEKDWGPHYLTFDMNLSTDLRGGTAWGLRAEMENRWRNRLGGEFKSAVQLGEPNVLAAGFYQPLDLNQRFFLNPFAKITRQLQNFFQGNVKVSEVSVQRSTVAFDAGVALGTWGEYRAGILRGVVEASTRVGQDLVPSGTLQLAGLSTILAWDTMDKPFWPRQGMGGSLSAFRSLQSLGADADYSLGSGKFGVSVPTSSAVWSFHAEGGTDFGTGAPAYDQFKLGGLFTFSGYEINQLVGREYSLGRVMFRQRVAVISEMAGSAVYVGSTLEAGSVRSLLLGTPDTGTIAAGSVFLSVDTRIGPICFAYGQAEGGHSAFYLYLGSSFDLFRP
jgi:NTE family protein